MTESNDASRALDAATIEAVKSEVAEAKARGWLQNDLKRHFTALGLETGAYGVAVAGGVVSQSTAAALAQVSITGLPHKPRTTNREDIRRHIEWLIEPALGDYGDALFEIAYDVPPGGCNGAKLFDFSEIDEAVSFAADKSDSGVNVYIAAALKLPDTPRNGRARGEYFYAATAVPIDIDEDYDATRAAMAAVCDDGLVVTTGLVPERRSQHWARLLEPVDSEADFVHAFAALVVHTGADFKVKDGARIMRLGGTVAYPHDKKQAKGYCTETTSVAIKADARPTDIERLKGLEPAPAARLTQTERQSGASGEIVRDWTGRVVDGRESEFRNMLLRSLADYQESTGCDPTPQEIFDAAFVEFSDPRKVDNKDGRWTSPAGQQQLMARATNTIRRLETGRLAKVGLFSVNTGVGEAEAKAVAERRQEARKKPEEPYVAPSEAIAAMSAETATTDPVQEFEPGPIQASAFHGEPPARRWVVEDWIVEGAVNSLYGDGGLGKTLLAQQLACCVSMGATWLGMPTIQGSVLAVLCEDDEGELHRRHNDIKSSMGYAVGNPFDDVWLWPRVGFDNVLVRWDRDGRATLGPFAEKLIQQINEKGPSLVVLDTLADFYGGNEIDRVQVNYFVKVVLGGLIAARKAAGVPLTVLLLGHPSVAGKASGSGYSGSTAWNNAVRSRMYLTRPEEGAGDERLLTRGKANYAKSGDETGVRLFYENGVLHASDDVKDDDALLWGAVREAVAMIGRKWDSGSPYNDRKDHDRFIHKALVTDLMHAGYKPMIARQAVRECIEDGKVKSGASNGKRGYRCI